MNKNNEQMLKLVLPVVKFLHNYHQYKVVGIERFPAKGSVLVVCSHSLATYDIALLGGEVYLKFGRAGRALAGKMFYKFPVLGSNMLGPIIDFLGGVEGSHENAVKLLKDGEAVFVAPGGMRESLRSSKDKYQISWHGRKGFVKLAIETQTPIILAACPAADDIYDIYTGELTKTIYELFKVPFALAKGMGPTMLPKPVALTHYLSPLISPPKMPKDPVEYKEVVNKFHASLVRRMKTLMSKRDKN